MTSIGTSHRPTGWVARLTPQQSVPRCEKNAQIKIYRCSFYIGWIRIPKVLWPDWRGTDTCMNWDIYRRYWSECDEQKS